ncbi:MAG: hypothetical protein J3K34DRAFT_18813 [Monoraphidium minutum]|nr:MAG: hypothetical protein J3K34DRAFT_18813 [Monoraphidium minutum]
MPFCCVNPCHVLSFAQRFARFWCVADALCSLRALVLPGSMPWPVRWPLIWMCHGYSQGVACVALHTVQQQAVGKARQRTVRKCIAYKSKSSGAPAGLAERRSLRAGLGCRPGRRRLPRCAMRGAARRRGARRRRRSRGRPAGGGAAQQAHSGLAPLRLGPWLW